MAYADKKLLISDLSDPALLAGTYQAELILDDGRDKVTFKLTFVIKNAEVPAVSEAKPAPQSQQQPQPSSAQA